MTLRAAIDAALASCASRCLDDEADRAEVAARLEAALLAQPDAARLRAFFAQSTTDGQRLIAVSASNGRVQSEVIEMAYRLAGGR